MAMAVPHALAGLFQAKYDEEYSYLLGGIYHTSEIPVGLKHTRAVSERTFAFAHRLIWKVTNSDSFQYNVYSPPLSETDRSRVYRD